MKTFISYCVVLILTSPLVCWGQGWSLTSHRFAPGLLTGGAVVDGIYYVLQQEGSTLYASTDGYTFTLAADQPPFSGRLKNVGERLYLLGAAQRIALYDGAAGRWSVVHEQEGVYGVEDMAEHGGFFVAVGGSTLAEGADSLLLWSRDGVSWIRSDEQVPLYLSFIQYVNDSWVTGGGSIERGGYLLRGPSIASLRSLTATQLSPFRLLSLSVQKGGWLIATGNPLGSLEGGILSSSDGNSWVSDSSFPGTQLQSEVTYFKNQWLVCGRDGIWQRSAQGWRQVVAVRSLEVFYGFSTISDALVAHGSNGLLYATRDGVTWQSVNADAYTDVTPQTRNDGPVRASGVDGGILVRPSGQQNWTYVPIAETTAEELITRTVRIGLAVYALTNKGRVLMSENLIDWRVIHDAGGRLPDLYTICEWQGRLWGVGPKGLVADLSAAGGLKALPVGYAGELSRAVALDDQLFVAASDRVFTIGSDGSVHTEAVAGFIYGLTAGPGTVKLLYYTRQGLPILRENTGKGEWTAEVPLPYQLQSIAYGGGYYRGVAYDKVYASLDGREWWHEFDAEVSGLVADGQGGTWTLSGSGVLYDLKKQAMDDSIKAFSGLGWRGAGSDERPILGFSLGGPATQRVIVQAVGPSLVRFGLASAVRQCDFDVVDATGTVVQSDDGELEATQRRRLIEETAKQAGAMVWEYLDTGNASHVYSLKPGTYTVVPRSTTGDPGAMLIEAYSTTDNSGLRGGSLRSQMSAGFSASLGIVTGRPLGVMLRGSGPSLLNFGVQGLRRGPLLSMVAADGSPRIGAGGFTELVQQNAQAFSAGMGLFRLNGSDEPQACVPLPAGVFTATAESAGADGVALLELYALPLSL